MKLIAKIINRYLRRIWGNEGFSGSKNYWESRYRSGDNSGSGSYGKLALFKAKIINDFVKANKIKSVVEFGCGDGNQLALFKIPSYIGLDVSKTAVDNCINNFSFDKTKSFFIYDSSTFKADLTLSLDVIFHLVEDKTFEKYMNHLFSSAKKYVIIYSSNENSGQEYHIKHRKFTDWVKKNASDWKLVGKINNKYPQLSFSKFYIFQRI